MCGISGYYCWGTARPHVDTIQGLLIANETRGKDATGLAWHKGGNPDGQIMYTKSKGKASAFVPTIKAARWEEIAASPRVIMHTRAKTKGSADDNVNNHPVIGYGWVVTHNGAVQNDDDLFEWFGDKRTAEVDTIAIPLVLGKGHDTQSSMEHLTTIRGNASLAAWFVGRRQEILLARLGSNEVFLFLDEENQIMYWSSALCGAQALPSRTLGNVKFHTMSHLQEDRCMVLTPDSMENVGTFVLNRKPFWMTELEKKALRKSRGWEETEVKTAPPVPFVPSDSSTQAASKSTTPVSTDTGELVLDPDDKYDKAWKSPTQNDGTFWVLKWNGMYAESDRKPDPLLADMLSPSDYHFGTVLASMTKQPIDMDVVLPTGYGRWKFKRTTNGIVREFEFHKRVRKWIFEEPRFSDFVGTLSHLPIVNALGGPADDHEHLEYYSAAVARRTGRNEVSIQSTWLHYMCPWCGIIAPRGAWVGSNLRCAFCNIKSQMPLPATVNTSAVTG